MFGHKTSGNACSDRDLYKTINSTPLGDVKWKIFSTKYTKIQPEPTENSPPWMNDVYNVWFHTPLDIIQNIVVNPDFATRMDFCAYQEFETATNVRDWAKQTAHQNTLALIGFLVMPKTEFCQFRHQIVHSSLSMILQSIKLGMTTPEIMRSKPCWIALYETVVQSWDFKEHTEALVEEFRLKVLWDECGIVGQLVVHTTMTCSYLRMPALSSMVLTNIWFSIAAVAPFTGSQCFLQGQHSKQWTGNNSKALMKVYLTAIEGHIPNDIMHAFHAFLEFCYLIQCNIIAESTLDMIQDALDHFHQYCEVFHKAGVVFTFSLSASNRALFVKNRVKTYLGGEGSLPENKSS
ncbi:hypothetical protein BDN67DRAFT_984331 [Paxillus ammoniavirescens]|nr:hypothetical protein BDN67DRAFT_984331 [Paxillus ammoniavirescens]